MTMAPPLSAGLIIIDLLFLSSFKAVLSPGVRLESDLGCFLGVLISFNIYEKYLKPLSCQVVVSSLWVF